ncbi:MAG: FtsX-like permease family protein [Blastocatellia bacterium]|nr:FtsX-like permease family protein [Blastocatellia bacterium]
MLKHLCKLVWNRKRVNFLITLEIFFSFLVVFAVTVLAVYYANNYRAPLGFQYENIWTIQLSQPRRAPGADSEAANLETAKRLLAALREFGEVESAAGASLGPYLHSDWTTDRKLKDGTRLSVGANQATDELADTLGLRLLRGRWFSKADDGVTHYKPVVINQLMARALFGDEDPIGKNTANTDDKGEKEEEERVIGVIEDFRSKGEFSDPRGVIFYRQNFTDAKSFPPEVLLARMRPGTRPELEEKIVARLESEAKDWSLKIKPMPQLRKAMHQEYLVPMAGFAIVAGFLLLMVALGLLGVLWQNVTQRTHEIGLRRAKGATRQRIYRQILGELLITASAGLLVGVLVVVQFPLLNLLGFATPRVYAISIAVSLAVIYAVTILCGLYPSRLATTVQPAEALHYE